MSHQRRGRRRWGAAMAAIATVAAGCAGDDTTAADTTFTMPAVTAAPGETDADEPDTTDQSGTDSPAEEPSTADADEVNSDNPDGDAPRPAPQRTFGNLDAALVNIEQITSIFRATDAVVAPNGEWWVALWHGEVVVMDHRSGAVIDVAIDIQDRTTAQFEAGLLGMAIDDEAVYLNYNDHDGNTHIDAWPLDSSGRPGERREILTFNQPELNHNGGGMAFGPDGYLYIGSGDGGPGGDRDGNGQNPDTLLGAILRIDPTPTASDPYAIPPDNPYADGGGAPEIFMIGARNPWRISFDSQTGDFWVADVGEGAWEEINLLLFENHNGRGQNLGWALREGTHEFYGGVPPNHVDPVFEYNHEGDPGGCSVTGGHVYRGSAIPELDGAYLFADYCTAQLWALSIADGQVRFRDLGQAVPGREIVGFGVDPDGELVTFSFDGPISRIVPG